MKYIAGVVVLLCLSLSVAISKEFLSVQEAFKTKFISYADRVEFDVQLGEDIYMYHDKLQVLITEPQKIDITKELVLPKEEEYESLKVISKDFKLQIPLEVLESKIKASSYVIQVKYQGCVKSLVCYAPMTKQLLYIKK